MCLLNLEGHHVPAPGLVFEDLAVVTPHGLRVLVVDDEGLIRWAVGEELVHRGHSVLEAGDGETTRRILRTIDTPIDAVLLDYQLPDTRDLELLQDVRRLSPTSAVVMMTASDDPGLVSNATRLGAYAVIDKPFELRDIDPLLREAFNAHESSARAGARAT